MFTNRTRVDSSGTILVNNSSLVHMPTMGKTEIVVSCLNASKDEYLG